MSCRVALPEIHRQGGLWCAGKPGRRRHCRARLKNPVTGAPPRPTRHLFGRGSWPEVRREGDILRVETVALPAAGGFLLQTITQSIGAPAWVIDLSPFAHLAPVPLADANWPATLAMSAIAVALTVAGGYGYQRRDLRG